MTDESKMYALLMRTGSLVSVTLLAAGLVVSVFGPVTEFWHWRNSVLYLVAGVMVLFATPLMGIIFLTVRLFQKQQKWMAWWTIGLIVLLFGGTWLLHVTH